MGRTRKDKTPAAEETAPVAPEAAAPSDKEAPVSVPAPQPEKGAWRRWLVQFALPVLLGVGGLGAVLWGGREAAEWQRRKGRQTIAFTDIACDPPKGMTREDFLLEAQYCALLPDHRFNLLDESTPARLHDGLRRHPLVESARVVVAATGARAEIVYRIAVLKVRKSANIVDRTGVLLPASAGRAGLPVLQGDVKAPVGKLGKPWGDEQVTAAAQLVARLGEKGENLEGATVELQDGEWTVRSKGALIHREKAGKGARK